jgi:type VI secretion system protein ImpJ
MRDGTLVSVPAESTLPEVDLQPVFKAGEGDKLVMVYLAVPVVQLGRPNVPGQGRTEGTRYFAEPAELEDENTGDNPQPVQIRRLNLRLLLDTEDRAGYETLPIARIKRAANPGATPQLDDVYIPPLLACDAWKTLQQKILQKMYDQIGTAGREQARLIVSQGITFSSQNLGEVRRFEQVRILNEAYSVLNVIAMASGIHPLWAYAELCRLVGQLSIFDETTRRPPALPRYDHDDLGGCFYRVMRHIEALIPPWEPEYEEAPFIGAGWRVQVAIQQNWLLPTWRMFVGVESPLKTEECVRMLTERGRLEMKIASAGRVDLLFTRGLRGLVFTHCPEPPRVLPSRPGLSYFQIERASQAEEWTYVQSELTLAIRLNKDMIVGSIQDQDQLTIKIPGQAAPTTMRFMLYVVPGERT